MPVTYKLQLIITSASLYFHVMTTFFILTSSYWYWHLRHCTSTSWPYPSLALQHVSLTSPDFSGGSVRGVTLIAINKSHWKITSRSTPIQILVVVAWERVTLIAINESHWKPVVVAWEGLPWLLLIKATNGSHGEWWVGWLAGRSINPTHEDVNMNFNHPS